MITWESYVAGVVDTIVRRPEGATSDRPLSDSILVWGLGLGGEFTEMLAEVDDLNDPLHESSSDPHNRRAIVLEECGDKVWYLAALYHDAGCTRRAYGAPRFVNLQWVARKVGRVVETIKKALRKEGHPGLVRLTISEGNYVRVGMDAGEPVYDLERRGRREEFNDLLDHAIGAVEAWLIENGSSLSEVMEANRAKLLGRKDAGTLAEQGPRKEKDRDVNIPFETRTPKRGG